MKGKIAEALALVRVLHQAGATPPTSDPAAEFRHFVTRAKIAPVAAVDLTVSEIERERGRELAES